MKRFLILATMIFSLGGCALFTPEPSIYSASSYQRLSWAKHSFDEMVARCRHTSLHTEQKWSRYKIRRPLFKACMEHYGFRYLGSSEINENDDPSVYRARGLNAIFPSTAKPMPRQSEVRQSEIKWNDAPVVPVAEEKQEIKTETETKPDKSALYR